jgi:hypothetical protein
MTTSSIALQLKAKTPELPLRLSPPRVIPSKNAKKKKHNVDKREVLQAHAA